MAVDSKDTNHPKLLLVDTPSKEGIDKENLFRPLSQIRTLYKLGKKRIRYTMVSLKIILQPC